MEFDEAKLLIEDFFNGKLEVKKFLGEGSFANVYLVNHNYLDTLMALKIIKEPLNITTNKKTIFREVTLASQLRHENIINIYDAAEISCHDDVNHAYFLMEYVPGGDLEQFLNSFNENNLLMPIESSLDLIRQILRGLNVLHSANPPIVHRDLKLNNVLISYNVHGDIAIKISDFGFAKEITSTVFDIDIAGTRPYMAPELFKKSVSLESDVYAIGVMFYQLLTNQYPYDTENYSNDELIDLKPWNEDLKPPSYYNDDVFDDLDRIVLKCLEFNPSNRYGDAGEVFKDVEMAIEKFKSIKVTSQKSVDFDYRDEYDEIIINDSIKKAFELSKYENKLPEAIEILEREVLKDYNVRQWYSETLRIWKSKRPDMKLISKAFTIILKAKNYRIACDLLKEAIAYNPSLKHKYRHYIDLWKIFADLGKHKSLFKAVVSLEELMRSSSEIKQTYINVISTLKTCSIDEIVMKSIYLINLNKLLDAANLLEFAVICDSRIREKYEYNLSLLKQNMKLHSNHNVEVKENAVDYAIDLGTTDSVMTYFNDGDPIVIKNHRTGEDFTPSAVLIDEDGVEVGVNARNAILENNQNAVTEFKNNMGFSLPFYFEESSRFMLPEELSAEVLKDLRVSAYNEMGVNIEDVVICVPADSNPLKIRAINDACDLAGFRSHNLIFEPIAIGLAYDIRGDDGLWMIYDMGGATFNVTLIRNVDGVVEKVDTLGLENFGGDALDWRLVDEMFKPKIETDLGLDDFSKDNSKYFKVFGELKNLAEISKKNLSKLNETDICVPNLFDDYDFNINLNRMQYEEIIKPLINHTFNLCHNLLNQNSLTEDKIGKIILAGGSSLSPIIHKNIEKEFKIPIESSINPLTVVAKGAAIYAGSIEKPITNTKKQPLSILLKMEKSQVIGKVFSNDLKYSFLGHCIELKNKTQSIKIPLGIDGLFKFKNDDLNHEFSIIDEDNQTMELDEKSPDSINNSKLHIPYFNQEFDIKTDINIHELTEKYSRLLCEIDHLKEYDAFEETDLIEYVDKLLEISHKDDIALNQINIYINCMHDLVQDSRRNLEFNILCENVLRKNEIISKNNLFKIENPDEIIRNKDISKLKDYYNNLLKKYVVLNENKVIEECFFNLKLNGIYQHNQELAKNLIDEAHMFLNQHNYKELLRIINHLNEIDERKKVTGVI